MRMSSDMKLAMTVIGFIIGTMLAFGLSIILLIKFAIWLF